MHARRILIADHDPDLASILEQTFSQAGAQVHTASSGQQALCHFHAHRPDLVILDALLPGLDGRQICSRISQISDVPIIMLGVPETPEEIVCCLDAGAVDCVSKPFSPRVLAARARALLRCVLPSSGVEKAMVYDDGHLSIDLERGQVVVGGEPVELTGTEYRLLAYLFQNAGRMLTGQQILEHVWGPEYQESTEYVHAYIWRLRQKLEEDARHPKYLVSRRGVGYRFEPQAP